MCQSCRPGQYCAEPGLSSSSGPCSPGYYCIQRSHNPMPQYYNSTGHFFHLPQGLIMVMNVSIVIVVNLIFVFQIVKDLRLRFSSLGMCALEGTTAQLAVHDQNPAHQVEFETNIYPKIKIMTLFTNPHVISNLYGYVSSVSKKGDIQQNVHAGLFQTMLYRMTMGSEMKDFQ